MKELKQLVSEAFDRIVASGAIEQAIEKKLTDTITSAIDEQLRSYSDFGKDVKEQVAKAIGVDLSLAGLPTYGHLVTEIIRRQVEAQMHGEFAARLEKDIAALLAPAPAEISLEALVEEFIKAHEEGREGRKFTLLIEDDGCGFQYVYLDPSERTDKYSCNYRIGVHKGEVFSLNFGRQDVQKNLFIGPLGGFEKLLFQLFHAKSKLAIPAGIDTYSHDYPTSFPWHD
jgi:hypothetical protein